MIPQRQEEITLESIDFEWVDKQTSVKQLKRALKILKDDGGYFQDLMNKIQDKMEEIDPKEKSKRLAKNIDPETRKLVKDAMEEWEDEIKAKEKQKEERINSSSLADNIFENLAVKQDYDALSEEDKKKKAESERIKGNEALKSGDLKEAIQYYGKSLYLDPKMETSYCNRALAHLKLKDYRNCIEDCNKALDIKPNYTKALHRRGKAHLAMERYGFAVQDFQTILKIEPENSEVNKDLMDARSKMATSSKGSSADTNSEQPAVENKANGEKANGGFKKIQI